MVDERKLEVLRAIVEDYVHSREPVGSKALVNRHHLGVSSATIRNDMVALEEEGLISAPHTSAGRIPTDKGYRLFVDQLANVRELSGAEKRAIQSLVEGATDVDSVLERTARLLSQITNQVAVIQYPKLATTYVRHLEMVSLAPKRLLVILIFTTGKVSQTIIELDLELSESDITILRSQFLASAVGVKVDELGTVLDSVQARVDPQLQTSASQCIHGLKNIVQAISEDRIVMAGTANLARSTVDFPLSISPVLDALEEQVVMLRLFSEMAQDSRGVSVSIGRENPHDSLAEASIVATGYGHNTLSQIGVLGPTRMDYSNSMAAVRAVARYLSRIIAN